MSATYACFDASIPRTVPSATTLEGGPTARAAVAPPSARSEPGVASDDDLRGRVHRFVRGNAVRVLVRARELAASRPAATELGGGVAELLEALLGELASGARLRGASRDRRRRRRSSADLDVTRVILAYVDIRAAVVELAKEPNIWIARGERDALDRCVVEAAARAAGEYAHCREEYVASSAADRLASLTRDLRDRVSSVAVAYGLLESEMKVRGRAAELLARSISSMAERVEELADVPHHGGPFALPVGASDARGDSRGGLVYRMSTAAGAADAGDRSRYDLDSSAVGGEVDSNGARLVVRTVPDGCVLSIELPRHLAVRAEDMLEPLTPGRRAAPSFAFDLAGRRRPLAR
ncbi:MAG: hypothetical protein KF850_12175 [Labilithrix sp.]|nr:hypothetical protein [Labilithrix sp.]